MRAKSSVFLVLSALLILIGSAAYFGVFPPFVITSTVYAPNYSAAAFDEIQVGDSIADVTQAMGRPLITLRTTGGEMLHYSANRGWARCYHGRLLFVTNGVVAQKTTDLLPMRAR